MPITMIITGVILMTEALSWTFVALGAALVILGVIDLLVSHQRHPPSDQVLKSTPTSRFSDEIRERKKNVFRANYYFDIKKRVYKCEVDRENEKMVIIVRVLNTKTNQWHFSLSFNPPVFFVSRENVYEYLKTNWGEFQD